jgi:hypothetical protein
MARARLSQPGRPVPLRPVVPSVEHPSPAVVSPVSPCATLGPRVQQPRALSSGEQGPPSPSVDVAAAFPRQRASPLRAVAESLRARHAQPVPMPPVAGALQARPSLVQISELPRAQHPVPDRPSPPWLAMVTEQPSRPRRCPCSPPRPFVYLRHALLLLPSASCTRQVSRARFRT